MGFAAGFFIFPHVIHWSWWLVLLLALGGCAMAIAEWTGFRAASQLDVTPFQTINRLTGVTAILLGWSVLGEGLGRYQLIGAITILVAALLAIWSPVRRTKLGQIIHLDAHAAALALISAIMLGIALVTEKAVLGHMDIGGGLLVGWGSHALAMIVLAAKDLTRKNRDLFRGYELRWSTLMGVANGLNGVFYVYAVVHADNVSLITALTAVTLPLAVLASYLFLHEREHHFLMWTSLGISFAGLLISALH